MTKTKSLKFELLENESLYSGFFQLNRYTFRNQLFAGGWSETFQREIFERGHAAAVLLLDPQKDVVVLVEQFRPGATDSESNPWLLELVAGMIEQGEQPQNVARRESVEEAGCEINRLAKICEYLVSPGGTTERIWLYIGEIDSALVSEYGGLADEHEDIKIHKLSVEDAFRRLDKGQINNAMTLIGLQWLKLNWHKKDNFWDN